MDRRNADRKRLAELDIQLDDLDEKAKELERRTRDLLDNGWATDTAAKGRPSL